MTNFPQSVIEALISTLDRYYVIPEITSKIASSLRAKASTGKFDLMSDFKDFATALNNDLLQESRDKHLRIRYNPGEMDESDEDMDTTLTPEMLNQIRKDTEYKNFGFYKVERLDGNIGYMDIRSFVPTEVAGETAVAAMNFLANTYCLIIDLRKNYGGVPSMVDLICGYLFRPSVHLNSLYWRKNDTVEQYWSLPYVPGKHYGNKPVYVLTSNDTFSGGEEFAYVLQQRNRVIIVGERTKGGANPGMVIRITPEFEAFIPMGRAIHPLTGTNWEGVGVQPDVETVGDNAFQVAYRKALSHIVDDFSLPEFVRSEAHQVLKSC